MLSRRAAAPAAARRPRQTRRPGGCRCTGRAGHASVGQESGSGGRPPASFRAHAMARQTYATPTDDQIAWRDAAPGPGTLPPHLVAFLQCGLEPVLGSCRADGRPLVGTGVGCRVDPGGLVRVFAPAARNRELMDAFRAGAAVAATFSRASDHRSIQLKARQAEVSMPVPDDLCEIARQCAIACDGLVELGYTRPQAEAYNAYDAADLAVVAFRPERVFTQTPGPGAGAELGR